MSAPISQRQKLLGMAVETTAGTFNAPASPLNAQVFDVTGGPSDLLPEQQQPALGLTGTAPRSVGMERGQLSFRHALASGDDFLGVILQGIGYISNGGLPPTYEPGADVSAYKTLSAKIWEGGRVKKFSGLMMSSMTLSNANAGSRVMAEYTFDGKWEGAVAEAMPTHTRTARNFYQAKGVTLNMGGAAYAGGKVGNFSLNMNPAAEAREDITSSTALAHWLVTDRTPQLELDPEAVLVATHDAYGKLLSGEVTSIAITLTDGAATPKSMAIAMAAAQRINVQDQTRGQKLVDALTFECHQSATADGSTGVGDDVTFKET